MRRILAALGVLLLCPMAEGADNPFARSLTDAPVDSQAAPAAKSPSPSAPQFGTDVTFVQIPPAAFQGHSLGTGVGSDVNGGRRWASSGFPFLIAPVAVPDGARIVYLELDYLDQSPSDYVSLGIFDCTYLGDPCTIFPNPPVGAANCGNDFGICSGTTETTSAGGSHLSADVDIKVNNYLRHYHLIAGTGTDGATRLAGAIIGYRLEVSPAPLTATFPNDVPTNHPFFRFIEALAAAGITAGCSPGSYCPNNPITRGEMAVFLAAALGLHWN